MSPALPDGTTWMNVPPPKKPAPELGGDGDPGTYEADAGYNDPETLRLAKVIADGLGWDWNRSRTEHIPSAVECCTESAAAVLADLHGRYVLVPREGAEVTRMHQISDPDGGRWETVAMDANLDPRVPFRHRYWTVVVGPLEDAP